MNALELAYSLGIDVEPKEGNFYATDRNYIYQFSLFPTLESIITEEDSLNLFEIKLQTIQIDRDIAKNELRLKEAALAKLSEEEKRVLGLI